MVTFHIFWTAALLIVFALIVVWAWSGHKKTDFQQAASLPLEEASDNGKAGSKRYHTDQPAKTEGA